MIMKRINDFLDSIEDPEKPFFGPNYWLLRKVGYIIPQTRVQKYVNFFMHDLFYPCFVVTELIELYLTKSDMTAVLTNIQLTMVCLVFVVKSNSFMIWQHHWTDIIDYVTEADLFERNSDDPDIKEMVVKYTKYGRKITYFYWGLTLLTYVSIVGFPFLRYFTSASYRERLVNGTEPFSHVYSSWVPYDKNHAPGSWITVGWHILMCTYGASTMAAYDSSTVVLIAFIGAKLDLLRERCRKMLGSNGGQISDEDAFRNIGQMHQIHVDVLKYTNLLNSMLSPVMFLYVFLCSIIFCSTAYQLTGHTDFSQKLKLTEYMLFGITQLFLFCWHSNDNLDKFEDLSSGPYESDWWAASVPQRKGVLLLAGQMRISKVYTAGPFTNLTLYTFITIQKGAYSYYTLLNG